MNYWDTYVFIRCPCLPQVPLGLVPSCWAVLACSNAATRHRQRHRTIVTIVLFDCVVQIRNHGYSIDSYHRYYCIPCTGGRLDWSRLLDEICRQAQQGWCCVSLLDRGCWSTMAWHGSILTFLFVCLWIAVLDTLSWLLQHSLCGYSGEWFVYLLILWTNQLLEEPYVSMRSRSGFFSIGVMIHIYIR